MVPIFCPDCGTPFTTSMAVKGKQVYSCSCGYVHTMPDKIQPPPRRESLRIGIDQIVEQRDRLAEELDKLRRQRLSEELDRFRLV